jgi:calcineurin-like phosphoesterase family protein
VSVWFTADPHFGHRFVGRLRGFGDDTEEHDLTIMENWRRLVGKNDQVWVLGDLCMTNPDDALDIIEALPGVKHFIAGNHDACHPMHRDAHKHQRTYLRAFQSVQMSARRRILGQNVLLSHFPYAKDRHEARYMQWRLRDEGEWLIHGHTHESDQRREGREIHVGLDAWGLKPVHISTIEQLMKEDE